MQTLPTTPPSKSKRPVAGQPATGGMVTLQWSFPFDHGGSPIMMTSVGFKLLSAAQHVVYDFVNLQVPRNQTSIFNLLANTSYLFAIRAANIRGSGLWGDPLLYTTLPASQPTVPTNLRFVSASYDSLTLAVNPPSDSGGVLPKDVIYRFYMRGPGKVTKCKTESNSMCTVTSNPVPTKLCAPAMQMCCMNEVLENLSIEFDNPYNATVNQNGANSFLVSKLRRETTYGIVVVRKCCAICALFFFFSGLYFVRSFFELTSMFLLSRQLAIRRSKAHQV
jgi:hypothetical protein